jgi:hypothetical protein
LRTLLAVGAIAVLTAGCATAPRQTVSELDRGDPEYASRDCRQARAAATNFEEHKEGRIAIAVAGNLVVPFAGSAAALAMSKLKNDERQKLNQQVRAACISDPLAKKRARVASR